MHTESLAVGICSDCGKNFCGDCLFFVKTYVQESRKQLPKYAHFCSDCMKRKGLKYWREPNQALAITGVLMMYIAGAIMIFKSFLAGIFFFFISFALLFASQGGKCSFPTVRMVMEKMSELNRRAEKVKASMIPREVEDLYRKMFIPVAVADPWTGKVEYSRLDRLLERHMKSGLSRREAIFKIGSEKGLEIKPGLHIPPTIGDALSELRKKMRRAESDRKRKK